MVRKVDMKKIEDITKCQVTFSKRRSSLIKKAHEISVCCDVDIAFITFSPSGRVSKFCSQRRIEDLIHRYINLPVDKRFTHIKNVQEKQEKIHQLDRIKGDTNKLQYLEKQLDSLSISYNSYLFNLELQIKKRTLELQILEANIRDYELLPEQEPSLHQLMWCERNLKQSLEKVVARKVEMETQGGMPLSCYIDGRNLSWVPKSPPSRQLLMQLDPWISPYSAAVRESIFQGITDQIKGTPVSSQTPGSLTSHTSIKAFSTKNQSGISSGAQETLITLPTQQPSVDIEFSSILSNHGGVLDSSSKQNHLNEQDIVISLAQSKSNHKNGNWNISLPINGSFCTASASSATTTTTAKGLNLDELGLYQMEIGMEKYNPENDQTITTSQWFNPKITISQHNNVKQIDDQCEIDGNNNNSASNNDTKDSNTESGFVVMDQSIDIEKVDPLHKFPEVPSFDDFSLESQLVVPNNTLNMTQDTSLDP
ncbi:Agamous-like MADS-box protein AGL66 [Camellia lanceoleosa]|uniref:Agamous-like MADS-box protein AGL66 n=1 Tax=Camellia lanceoleosa TaxID=1840588 RepID=A0ACC0ISA2_9ERIC|nr:Agamous-like MADS-box protein AGL66 [Camellia lanceoleosa]